MEVTGVLWLKVGHVRRKGLLSLQYALYQTLSTNTHLDSACPTLVVTSWVSCGWPLALPPALRLQKQLRSFTSSQLPLYGF